MQEASLFCSFEGPWYLLFSENVPPIVYYSHLPVIILSLLLAFFVLSRGGKQLANRIFFFTLLSFVVWVFLDSIFWASNRSDVIMFVWSVIILIEPLVYVGCFYLLNVLVDKKDITFLKKAVFGVLFLPLIIFVPTKYTLSGFDLTSCLSVESFFAYYVYFVEIFFTLWLVLFAVKRYRQATVLEEKHKIFSLSVGMLCLLLGFSWGNITGSLTENWTLGQFGLFGMPFFAGFLTYAIVKYNVFNIKLIAAQALVVAQFILIGSMFFFAQSLANQILVGGTLLGTSIMGWYLIRSVKVEIQRKEELQKIAHELEIANEELRKLDNLKTEFLSFASHQLRTPLTAIKGYVSMLLEGSYGEISETIKDVLNKVYVVNTRLARLVEEFLNVSRIDAGRVQYNFEEVKIDPILKELFDAFVVGAKERGLELRLELPKQSLPRLSLDTVKIREVVSNLIDNSLKYTKAGSVVIRAARNNDKMEICVEDTGIGITPETMSKLFEKFSRSKETTKIEVSGTGLGLYVGKKFVEAHGGTIRAESKGAGQGSRFIVTLPVLSSRPSLQNRTK